MSCRTSFGTALVAVLALVATACSSAATQQTAQPPTATTPTPPTTLPTTDPVTIPTATVPPSPTPVGIAGLTIGEVSQTPADAERDGVHPAIAELNFDSRVEVRGEVSVGGKRWVLSALSGSTRSTLIDFWEGNPPPFDLAYGELLQIDDETIVRAVPMYGLPASWIASRDGVIYAGRIGDGGAPDSSLVRVDSATGDADFYVLPISYTARVTSYYQGSNWQIVSESAKAPIFQAISAMLDGDPAGYAAVESARRDLVPVDPSQFPTLGGGSAACGVGTATYFVDYGTQCAVERGNRCETCDSTVEIGEVFVRGTLLGGGAMQSEGPNYAAIAGVSDEGEAAALVLVDVNNPTELVDTGLLAAGGDGDIVSVSFFDGGLATTSFINPASVSGAGSGRVRTYDTNFQPTKTINLQFPAADVIARAAVAPDGTSVAVARYVDPQADAGSGMLTISVIDTATGQEQFSVQIDESPKQFVRWLDFDGRWVLVSLLADAPWRSPLLIDTSNDEVYPLGINPLQTQTLQRASVQPES